jgi:hypothetical protein
MGERAKSSLQVECLLLYTNNSRRHRDVRAHDPVGCLNSVLFPIHHPSSTDTDGLGRNDALLFTAMQDHVLSGKSSLIVRFFHTPVS